MLSAEQTQRLKNFCAHNSHRTDDMFRSFESRFARALPAIGRAFSVRSKRERYNLAAGLSDIVKHLDNLDAVTGELAHVGSRLSAAGFDAGHGAAFKGAILSALRRDAVGNWHAQTGEDWDEALDLIIDRMGLGKAAEVPMRMAA